MKSFRLFTLLLIVVLSSQAQIMNVQNRDKINLDGHWKIIVDPYDNGYYTTHLTERDKGYFLDYTPERGERTYEHDFNSNHTLLVPGDWNTQREDLFFYEGSIWYRRDFNYHQNGQRAILHFGAANYESIVYLNGEKLGSHTGGFTPFEFEVTNKLKEGNNYVVVKVDNKRKLEAVPTVITDWWNYGGITRDVYLLQLPQTYIRDYLIQLKKGSQNEVEGWVKLDGKNERQNVSVSIPELGINKKVTTDGNGYAEISFLADFDLWSPENPKLYDVIVKSNEDEVKDKIGFRSITTKGEDLLLNGKKVFLRGISIHEVAPFRAGRAFSEEDAYTLLNWAKELNCNYVRLAHYPHNVNMLKMADKLGLMVWAEVPVYWAIQYDNLDTYQNAENQISAMIKRDKNHPSIVLWSIANETPVIEKRTKFLTKLATKVRELDSTRLITAALRVHFKDTVLEIDDPLAEVIDVLGVNEYIGWYEGVPDTCKVITWKNRYNKPVMVSEFGAGALYGKHGEKNQRWTEEYQANVYKNQVSMIKRVPFIVGMSPWILMDFLSPRRPLYGIQDWFNRKGLISNNGEKKKAFFVLQQFYKEKKEK